MFKSNIDKSSSVLNIQLYVNIFESEDLQYSMQPQLKPDISKEIEICWGKKAKHALNIAHIRLKCKSFVQTEITNEENDTKHLEIQMQTMATMRNENPSTNKPQTATENMVNGEDRAPTNSPNEINDYSY